MILLVLPAYNEAGCLGSLLRRVCDTAESLSVPLCVLVVDDGSSDGTGDVAAAFSDRLRIDVLTHATNQGLAAAIKTGLAAALERSTSDDDVIVTMDADDTHPPDLIPGMLAAIRAGRDLVIASRYVPGARVHGLTLSRVLYSHAASLLFRLLVPMPGVRDYTCGYRAYRASLLRRTWAGGADSITSESGFTCMADILLRCRDLAPSVQEMPLVLRYDRKRGASKMRVASTIAGSLRLLLRASLRRLARPARPSPP